MFEKLIKRAEVVIEALPYLRKFYGKTIVIKYGGNAMLEKELKAKVVQDVILLRYVGMNPVLIHGGGPEISKELKKKKIETKFLEGLRITDEKTMEVVEKVLTRVNSKIVALLNKGGRIARGISGKKGKIIRARKHVFFRNKQKIDIGFVGDVTKIDAKALRQMITKGAIPVISSIGFDGKGRVYNINADSVAAEIAAALGASKLILLTNVMGVLDKNGRLISQINASRTRRLIKKGVISGGMIPKVKCGLFALKKGVEKVHILDGRVPHAILLELFTDFGIGTMVER
ncbi:MAG: acetylglutamate kinase [Candidatus Saganbacteria bacterium]|nr:acetylglutamate kinase [Candidatus Saganbacteria bacterium]